ncbi:hypothetical protein B9J76_04760 [Lacticaseibacillus paracasei]|nr:hypothetical protein DMC16_01565 [Lacticaseibacillus paracasei]AYG22287.1 hypothetical protein CFM84_03465 [Lacticaseibacillus paracasei]OSP85058.1 hypothetical protein B9J76_04760 [Lacticaseibacillus paracasei]
MGLSRGNNTATGSGADVVRRLRDRGLCGLEAPSQRSSPSWPEIAEFGTAETRSQPQKPAHKDLKPKWPRPSHLGLRPLMLRFLNAAAHALI